MCLKGVLWIGEWGCGWVLRVLRHGLMFLIFAKHVNKKAPLRRLRRVERYESLGLIKALEGMMGVMLGVGNRGFDIHV